VIRVPPESEEPQEEFSERPSKSALKREMTARQALGEALCELSPRELEQIPIDDAALLEAIREARTIRSHSAARRHRQYIGKLMRRIDPQPLQAALDALYRERRAAADDLHELEALRDRLLAEGDAAIAAVVERLPDAERGQLRQLTRQAQRDREAGRNSGAARKLFRYLRDLREAARP
jgi:ribosome-associated protein